MNYISLHESQLYFQFLKVELRLLEKGTEKAWPGQKRDGGRTRQPLVTWRKNTVKPENCMHDHVTNLRYNAYNCKEARYRKGAKL